MRRFFLIYSLFLLLFLGCKNESPELIFTDIEVTTPTNSIVELYIPKAVGDNPVSTSINAHIESVVVGSFALNDEGIRLSQTSNYISAIDSFNSSYRTFKKEFPETSAEWIANIDGTLSFQSETLLTIVLSIYNYRGGAHGNVYIHILNFDPKTGALIPNKSLYTNEADFIQAVKPYFKQEVEDAEVNLFEPEVFKLPKQIGYNSEGVLFIYNLYEIAPYSEGVIEFEIPFVELKSLLNY